MQSDAPLHNQPGTTSNLGVHHSFAGAPAGRISFRVVEGKFTPQGSHDPSKMHLYAKIKLGWTTKKTAVAKQEGNNANWGGETISIEVMDQEEAKIKVNDKSGHFIDKTLGHAHIQLKEIILAGNVEKWIPIKNKDQVVGEVHLVMEFHPLTHGM